jgi:crossover junction endodeoxyribonuclease RuvC
MVARVLGLSEVPKPADAADALAIALCHAWKGPTLGTVSSTQTPAQRAWRLAEHSATIHRMSS